MGTNAHIHRGRDVVVDLVFGEMKLIKNDNTQKILYAAIEYVWLRGLVEFDFKWLHALFHFLWQEKRQSNNEGIICAGNEIKKMATDMCKEGSHFYKMRTSELHPYWEKKIKRLLSSIGSENSDTKRPQVQA